MKYDWTVRYDCVFGGCYHVRGIPKRALECPYIIIYFVCGVWMYSEAFDSREEAEEALEEYGDIATIVEVADITEKKEHEVGA